MNVIVVGGGKVGRKLVEDFNYEGDDVVLIDIKVKSATEFKMIMM